MILFAFTHQKKQFNLIFMLRSLIRKCKRITEGKKLKKRFRQDFLLFSASAKQDDRFTVLWEDRFPQLYDRTAETPFDAHYLYHPAWAARILAELKPERHVDISSTLHFCSIVSAFIPVEFYDYRPAALSLTGLSSGEADLTQLPFAANSLSSVSCMHTIEHIGLGRYGDPIDATGDKKAMAELARVVKMGGSLLFVVPVGSPKVQFNAHRIYGYQHIVDAFPGFTLRQFSLVTDAGEYIAQATKEQADGQQYGCGCFWFVKQDSI